MNTRDIIYSAISDVRQDFGHPDHQRRWPENSDGTPESNAQTVLTAEDLERLLETYTQRLLDEVMDRISNLRLR